MRFWLILLILAIISRPSLSIHAQDEGTAGAPGQVTDDFPRSPRLTALLLSLYAVPIFETPPVDSSLLHDRHYMQLMGMAHVYDAPDGYIVRTIDQGFNYVTVLEQRSEWAQINANEWVRSAYLTEANHEISRFAGVFLPDVLPPYPIAWVRLNTYPSSEPGGLMLEAESLITRYTLVYLFETAAADGESWLRIGDDRWLPETALAQVIFPERPPEVDTQRWMSIDLHQQVLVVYDDDRPIFATLVSAGLPDWPTYQGVFHITSRHTRRTMSWGTPGEDYYYLEDVPWTMFFDNGRALHGTYWHDDLGVLNSRGCLNLSITDAHWLYHWVAQEYETLESVRAEVGPAVYIYSSE
jgi:hypothetical protein